LRRGEVVGRPRPSPSRAGSAATTAWTVRLNGSDCSLPGGKRGSDRPSLVRYFQIDGQGGPCAWTVGRQINRRAGWERRRRAPGQGPEIKFGPWECAPAAFRLPAGLHGRGLQGVRAEPRQPAAEASASLSPTPMGCGHPRASQRTQTLTATKISTSGAQTLPDPWCCLTLVPCQNLLLWDPPGAWAHAASSDWGARASGRRVPHVPHLAPMPRTAYD